MTSAAIFLFQTLIIVAVPPIVANLLRVHYLPLVVIQIAIGIALGPSLLGRIAPEAYQALFAPELIKPIQHISLIALILFVFATGMHLKPSALRGRETSLLFISASGIAIPAAMGLLGGLWLAHSHVALLNLPSGSIPFAIGMAICSAITALPVLSALLREGNLLGHRIGQFALTIAAVNDLVLWVALSFFLAILNRAATIGATQILVVSVLVLYPIALSKLGRLVLNGAARRQSDSYLLVSACALALASACLTECVGLHYVLGAFLAGMVVPETLRNRLLTRIEPLTATILIPFFFISIGLKTYIDTTSSVFVDSFVVITVAAFLGKVIGTACAARLTGEPWRDALALGSLTQTKGLMEVVVVTILLDAGVFPQEVFSAVIVMALLSTLATMPLVCTLLHSKSDALP